MSRLGVEVMAMLDQTIALLPDLGIAIRIRRWFYSLRMRKAGRFIAYSGFKIFAPENVSIDDGASINLGVVVDASNGGEITIGKNVLMGPYCVLRAADHVFSDPDKTIQQQGHAGGKIAIEDDCWLGSHVVVTRDVTIGKGSVIGAHSVVTRDIPAYSVALGVPARIVRSRRSPAD